MKRLRVLTGRHAGTDLLLPAGRHVISAAADADIRLRDWAGDTLVLEIHEGAEDVYSAVLQFAGTEASETVIDLMPRQFGGTALCLGPADATQWPTDIELLDRLLRRVTSVSSAASGSTKRARHWLAFGATACMGLLAGTFIVVVSGAAKDAAAKMPPPSLVALAQKAVEAAQIQGVVVRAYSGGAIVEGLLQTPAEVAQLSAALDALPRGPVLRRYAASTAIAQSIAEALDEPHVSVTYLSNGDFVMEGSAVRAERLRAVVDRIAADLAPLVRSIRLNVTDLPPPPRTPVGAMLQADGMAYVQTRDGTKHLSFSIPSVKELTDLDLTPSISAIDSTATHNRPRNLR